MTRFRPGDVIFLDFPYAVPGASKQRPALVLLDAGHNEVVAARITSSRTRHRSDVPINDLSAAGLQKRSWVRLAKMMTVADVTVLRVFGQLTPTDCETVGQSLRHLFDLDWPEPIP